MKRVAVIGAGPLGLMGLKNLLEDGFEATAFEKRSYVGGLWKPTPEPAISASPNTVFNNSRFRVAITDFPFANDTSDYPTSAELFHYLQEYTKYFNLFPHVRLDTEVKGMNWANSQWELEIVEKGKPERKIEVFDKLLVATGSFTVPKYPPTSGIEKFKGSVIHSVEFWDPPRYKDQNVLVIGLHSTAQDVTSDLVGHANKVYLAHKSGLIMLPRYSPNGSASDVAQTLSVFFFQLFMDKWFPNILNWLMHRLLVKTSRDAFPDQPKEWNFSPPPASCLTTPTMGDSIYPLMHNGFAEPVSAVHRIIGPKSVELMDGRVLENIDSIVYCTGYYFEVPFMPKEYNPYPVQGAPPILYRNVFPLHSDPEIRNSLAFLGQAALSLPGFAQLELPAMAVSQIWRGYSSLPSLDEMTKWYEDNLTWRRNLIRRHNHKGTFYTAFVPLEDNVRWLDRNAGTGMLDSFGYFSWRAWQLWWSDPKLYDTCVNGVFSPVIWRLFDRGGRKPWSGARTQLFKDNAIEQQRRKQKLESMKKASKVSHITM